MCNHTYTQDNCFLYFAFIDIFSTVVTNLIQEYDLACHHFSQLIQKTDILQTAKIYHHKIPVLPSNNITYVNTKILFLPNEDQQHHIYFYKAKHQDINMNSKTSTAHTT